MSHDGCDWRWCKWNNKGECKRDDNQNECPLDMKNMEEYNRENDYDITQKHK